MKNLLIVVHCAIILELSITIAFRSFNTGIETPYSSLKRLAAILLVVVALSLFVSCIRCCF